MSRVLERRRLLLTLMRQVTLEDGSFTIADIAGRLGLPRSTVQDWVKRLVAEGCVAGQRGSHGRHGARFVAISAMPRSTCRRVFTTIDGDSVTIFHKCLSPATAGFCALHHRAAGGVIESLEREGDLLRETGHLGRRPVQVGLSPLAAVGVEELKLEGDRVIQVLRSIGGPAYSLSEMIAHADGVLEVRLERRGALVCAEVVTRALDHLVIGIDDTDDERGGATFALALALLQHLARLEGVTPIGHRVVMLEPTIEGRTAGNFSSYLELAVDPADLAMVERHAVRFVSDEAFSGEWGVAIKRGFRVPDALRAFAGRARTGPVTRGDALDSASASGISLYGGRGTVGALAAVGASGSSIEAQLDPSVPL
ncbi:MAG: MarR family transcriptional regulator [Methanospirillum sp.]|nr:MarR family transcriptional regulator [Methanospirillum sp.]